MTKLQFTMKEGWKGTDDENPWSPSGRALPKGHTGPKSESFECAPLLGLYHTHLALVGRQSMIFELRWVLSTSPNSPQDPKQQQPMWTQVVQRVVGLNHRFSLTHWPKTVSIFQAQRVPRTRIFIELTRPSWAWQRSSVALAPHDWCYRQRKINENHFDEIRKLN